MFGGKNMFLILWKRGHHSSLDCSPAFCKMTIRSRDRAIVREAQKIKACRFYAIKTLTVPHSPTPETYPLCLLRVKLESKFSQLFIKLCSISVGV